MSGLECRPRGCAAYTPCQLSDPAVTGERITQATLCAGLDAAAVEELMWAAYGKAAHKCLSQPELAQSGRAQLATIRARAFFCFLYCAIALTPRM